jgi:drug/metabolite transporter (DMT)-like permease
MTAIALLGVTRTAASAFLVPIFAVLLDVAFLNQLPSAMESIGGAMAILGFVLIAR